MTKQFKSVLAFGDSHVAGCELIGNEKFQSNLKNYTNGNITLEQSDIEGKVLAFPQIVADQLGIPCYNYSMSGGSNPRSIRLLTQALISHPNSLVLFGYTCTDRNEFFYPDAATCLGRDDTGFVQVGSQWNGQISKVVHHPINDIFVKKILRPYNNLKELMCIVDALCTTHADHFIHLPLFDEDYPVVRNLFEFESTDCYIKWCAYRQFNQLPYLHYDQEAHTELARLILENITNVQ